MPLSMRALLFAAAFVAAPTLSAHAASIDISAFVNSDVTVYTGGGNYPQNGGPLTVAGVAFDLTTGVNGKTAVIQGGVATYTIPVNLFGVDTIYTLMNSAYGASGATIGSLVFNSASSGSVTFNITEGDNIRDHFQDGFNNFAANTTGTANFGPDRFDMQTFILPLAFASDTLTSIQFISAGGFPAGDPFIAAIATAAATVPIPAALPLFVSGLLGLGLLARRRRQPAG